MSNAICFVFGVVLFSEVKLVRCSVPEFAAKLLLVLSSGGQEVLLNGKEAADFELRGNLVGFWRDT